MDGNVATSNQSDRLIISCGNYEGGLLGLSFSDYEHLDDITTEYAFSASEVT